MKKVIALLLILISMAGISGYCIGYETYAEASAWHKYIGFDSISYENPSADGGELIITGKGRNLSSANKLEIVLTPRVGGYSEIKADGKIVKSTSDMLPVAVNNVPVDYLEVERCTVEFKVILPSNKTAESLLYDIDTWADDEQLRHHPLIVPAGVAEASKAEQNWADTTMKVAVNGVEVDFPDQKPMYDDNTGRTYVPVRFLAENLGADVEWDEEHQVVEIVNKYIEGKDTKAIHRIKIGENRFVSSVYGDNGTAERVYSFYLPEDICPVMLNDRILLPFRYVAELLGAQVYYDDETSTAHCIKRDMSANAEDSIYPVLSTVLGEYFAQEVSAYRKEFSETYQLKIIKKKEFEEAAEVGFNNTLADIAVWNCFDHIEHPEWKARERLDGWAHVHSTSILDVDYSIQSDGSAIAIATGDAAFGRKYLDGRLPLGEIAFGENQAFNKDFRSYGGDDNEVSKKEYIDLAENWGINIKPHKNSEYSVGEYDEETGEMTYTDVSKEVYNHIVKVYNERAYRDICDSFISIWDHSEEGHAAWMKSLEFDDVALGYVGDRGYMTMAGY